jgi:uncharacterized protein (UPF0335 family)
MAAKEENIAPAGEGHNSIDTQKLEAYESRIMALHNDLEETSGQIRNDIKQVYADVKADLGIPIKTFKMAMAEKRANMKREKKRQEWDESERMTYEDIKAKLGMLDGTPLGDAALAEAA